MNSFLFFFMIYKVARYARYQSYIKHKDYTMEMKSNLYLRIILLLNYIMEENLFVYVEWSPVKHTASWFSVRKNVAEKKKEIKKDSDTWMHWYFRSRFYQFFIQKFHVLHNTLIIDSPLKPLTVISTNIFLKHLIFYPLLRVLQTSWGDWNLPKKQL